MAFLARVSSVFPYLSLHGLQAGKWNVDAGRTTSAPVMGSFSILMTRCGSPVARSIHIGMMCSRDRAALPTGQPQKTQFDHPGLFGALPRPEFCDILGRDFLVFFECWRASCACSIVF